MVLGTLLGVCVFLASAHTPRHGIDLRQYLAADGKLLAPLVYRDAQDGFAGVSGEVWTIQVGGHFSIARFLNERTTPPYWERDLTPDQLTELAKVLAANHVMALPERLGQDAKVNSHVLTLTFGKMKSELALPAGEDLNQSEGPPANDAEASAKRSFAAAVQALQELAKGHEGPPAASE
jgi:hypothetical protein